MKKMIATALITTLAAGVAFAQTAPSTTGASDAAPTTSTGATGAANTGSATGTNNTAATGTVNGSMVTSIPHMTSNQMASSKVVGTSVYNTNNEKIGEVNDLILDANGRVAGVVIGVGGFLGLGERNVAVSYNSVKFSKDNRGYERIMVPATKDQLKSMTPYDSSKTNG